MNDITKAEPGTLVAVSEHGPASLLNIIASLAAKDNPNVDALDRLMAAQERFENRENERLFNMAFAEMWPKLPRVSRKGEVDTGKGSYRVAREEDVDDAVREPMETHGFAFSFRTVEQDPSGRLTMEGSLIHKGTGFAKTSRMSHLPDPGPARSAIQAMGSAQTYLIKYIKTAMLAIVRAVDDDDGNSASGRPSNATHTTHGSARARATAGRITEDQELQINELLTETGADLEKFLANYSPFKSVSEFSQDAAQNAIRLLTRKKQQQADAKADAATELAATLDKSYKREAAEKAAQTEQPKPAQSAEEKPQATQALQFEAVLLDEYSEPVRDDPFTDVIQYVRALMGLWEKSKNREALMAHNADGIEDAKRLPAAATILKSMQEAPEPDPEEAELERIVTALKTYRDVKGINSLARSPIVEAAAERWGKTHRDLIARMKTAFDARRAELRAGA